MVNFFGYKIGGPLYQDDLLSDVMGAQVFVKDESQNPTHTHKDMLAASMIKKQLKRYKNVVFVGITDGGLAKSFGYLAKLVPAEAGRVRIASIIDKDTPGHIKAELEHYGPVMAVDLKKDRLNSTKWMRLVSEEVSDPDANIMPICGDLYELSGSPLYHDISDKLEHDGSLGHPYTVVLPIGGGTTFLEFAEGYLYDGEPLVIGGTTPGNWISEMPPDGFGHETRLDARFSTVKKESEALVRKYKIPIITVTRDERLYMEKFMQNDVGLHAGPTAAVAFAAAKRYADDVGFDQREKVVILNTGCETFPECGQPQKLVYVGPENEQEPPMYPAIPEKRGAFSRYAARFFKGFWRK